MNAITRHAIVAMYFSGRGSDREYSIWQVTDFGQPISVLSIEATWTECTVEQFQKGWPKPKPAEFGRQADAAKAGKDAARQADLAFDKNYRPFMHLWGPKQTCAACQKEVDYGWKPMLCRDCQVIYEHGRLAQGDKSAYMVGLHPGNNLSPYEKSMDQRYPLPVLLATLVGSKLRSRRGNSFDKDEEQVTQSVGYLDARYWNGGDMIVDITETQAVAWSALVEWIHSKLMQTERSALDQGTRLLTRLATGELSPEDFDPKVVRLRQGKSDG